MSLEDIKLKIDELIKSRSGIYKDTSENRKLGRVGQKYGSKKDSVKTDKSGNIIGSGDFHSKYDVEKFDKYPSVSHKVNKSNTTESVYVTYYNKDNNKSITVRFSEHESNAVKFGDQLNGFNTSRDEILYHLGLKERVFIPNKKLSIFTQSVSKKSVKDYEMADKTIKELYELGAGADISKYKGKLAKDSNMLILSDKITEDEEFKINPFGQKVLIGNYIYKDIKKAMENDINKGLEPDIIKALEENDLMKSWSTELQKKHPGGRWVTLRGAKIFVDKGGKIVAGNEDLRRKLNENKESGEKDGGLKEGSKYKVKFFKTEDDRYKNKSTIKEFNNFKDAESFYHGVVNNHNGGVTIIHPKKEEEKKQQPTTNKKEEKKQTKQEQFELPNIKNSKDLDKNVNYLLSQYGSREMASIQIESYLNENKDIAKEWLKEKNITTREGLKKYLANKQSKERKQIVADKKKISKEWEEAKTKDRVNDIIDMAREAESKMQQRIKESEKKESGEKDKKKIANKESKAYKEAQQLGKKNFNNESTEDLKKLQSVASKIDEKYLSKETKDKINNLIEDLYVNAYEGKTEGYGKRLKDSKSLGESLKIYSQLNEQLKKEDTFAMEEEDFEKVQKVISEALMEQHSKKTTESLQYKMFKSMELDIIKALGFEDEVETYNKHQEAIIKGFELGIYNENDLEKAIGHKYFKREPKAGGGYKYYYTEAQYKKEKQGGGEKKGSGKKLISVNPQIGKVKYSIDIHDGKSTHKDGSPFVGIRTFKTKKDFESGLKELKSQGYSEVSNILNSLKEGSKDTSGEKKEEGKSKKSDVKNMKKVRVNGLNGYIPGHNFIYQDNDSKKWFFKDNDGELMELKNEGTLKELQKFLSKK